MASTCSDHLRHINPEQLECCHSINHCTTKREELRWFFSNRTNHHLFRLAAIHIHPSWSLFRLLDKLIAEGLHATCGWLGDNLGQCGIIDKLVRQLAQSSQAINQHNERQRPKKRSLQHASPASLTLRRQSLHADADVAKMNTSTEWWRPADRTLSVWLYQDVVVNMVEHFIAKSMKTARTDWPSSIALCQWCTMSTRACVVDRPFNVPYWLTSSLSSILWSIHAPMNEIGRKSVSITWGKWDFGTGITLASFKRSEPKVYRAESGPSTSAGGLGSAVISPNEVLAADKRNALSHKAILVNGAKERWRGAAPGGIRPW